MRLERFVVGDELVKLGRKLNLLVDYCKAITPKSGENTRIRQTHAGAYISADKSPTGGGGSGEKSVIKSASYDSDADEFTLVLRSLHVNLPINTPGWSRTTVVPETTLVLNGPAGATTIINIYLDYREVGSSVPEYFWSTNNDTYGTLGANAATTAAEVESSSNDTIMSVGFIVLASDGGIYRYPDNSILPDFVLPRSSQFSAPYLLYDEDTRKLFLYNMQYKGGAPASLAIPTGTTSSVFLGAVFSGTGYTVSMALSTASFDSYITLGYIETSASGIMKSLRDYTQRNVTIIPWGITGQYNYVQSVNFGAETTVTKTMTIIDGVITDIS